jgi:hypothetical protein
MLPVFADGLAESARPAQNLGRSHSQYLSATHLILADRFGDAVKQLLQRTIG